MKRARIVVVGSSNTDMVVKTGRIPLPGETVLGGDFIMTPGGKGANQAVAAAKLGAEVWFVGRVGSDVFGDRAIENIAAAGVNTDYITRDPDAPSGVALIFVDENGQNSIVVAPGANGKVSSEDVEAARPAFEAADILVVQFEIPVQTVARAITLAKEMGLRVIVNPAPVPPGLPSRFFDGVDILTPNEHEACMILGRTPDYSFDGAKTGAELLELGIGTAVVTLGPKGAAAATQDGILVSTAPSADAVDTTAAGDCFTGALAVAIGEGSELGAALQFANVAAAISVTRMGAQASMPTRDEVVGFMSRKTA